MTTANIPDSPKSNVKKLLELLPETATWDDIEYAMYVQRKIREGERAISQGQYVSGEEARERMRKWLR